MQTVNEYKEALLLGHKAFEAQDHTAKPLPHIFGSAAYLQDPLAGLGTAQVSQSLLAEAVETQQSVHQPEQKIQHAAASQTLSAQQAGSTPKADTAENSDLLYQPQNFKAMLEAALKGEADLLTNEPHVTHAERSHPSRPELDADPARNGVLSQMLQEHEQPKGNASQANAPHVLAWLEQGRGLFDNDDSIDSSAEQT